jgi:hypothetical protein
MFLSFLFFSLSMPHSDTTFHTTLLQMLPTSINQWEMSEPPRFCSGSEIFDYMDGAGEVYLAYNYQHLLSVLYASAGEEEILVELFDMGSDRDAFGIFTYMMGRGPEYPIGQNAEYKNGLLCFWKGKYFAYVHIDNENKESKEAVLALGTRISESIPDKGDLPAILQILPEGIYLPASLRYFQRYEILNAHFFVARSNIFNLNEQTEAIIVKMKNGKSQLLIIAYPSGEIADSAYNNFNTLYFHDAKTKGIVQTQNNMWTASLRHVRYLTVVFDASTQQQALEILENIRRRLP